MFDDRLLDADALLERPRRVLRAMRTALILIPMCLMLASNTATASARQGRVDQADILRTLNETGATMATLNDWRAILLVAMVLAGLMLVGLLTVVFMSFRTITAQSAALGGVREAISGNTVVLARIESRMSPAATANGP